MRRAVAGATVATVAVLSAAPVVASAAPVGSHGVAVLPDAGALDTSWSGDGKMTFGFTAPVDTGYGVAVQSDGKLVVTGGSYASGERDMTVWRLNADGSLDSSFGGGDGLVTIDFGSTQERGVGVAIQPDGKIVVAGDMDLFGYALVARLTTTGDLDSTFSGDGKNTFVAFPNNTAQVGGLRLQSDGKLLVAGNGWHGCAFSICPAGFVARLTSTGNLDSTYGGDGVVFAGCFVFGMTAQADNKAVVFGQGYDDPATIVRLTTTGSFDTSFSGDGIDVQPTMSEFDAATVQADGKIVAAGQADADGDGTDDFAVARWTTAGALDTTFDGNGLTATSVTSAADTPSAVAVQSDGDVVVVGAATQTNLGDVAEVQYNSNGSLDTTFSTDGKTTVDLGGLFFDSEDIAVEVLIQPADQRIVTLAERGSTMAVARQTTTGPLDTTFSSDGIFWSNATNWSATVEGMALDGAGNVVAAATTDLGGPRTFGAYRRINGVGVVDSSFGASGQVITKVGASTALHGLVLSGTTAYVAGQSGNGTGEDGLFGQLLTGTGAATNTPFSFGSGDDVMKAVALTPDGGRVVAGDAGVSNGDFGLAKIGAAGNLDPTFSGDGIFTTGVGPGVDHADAVAVQADGSIVVGGRTGTNGYDFALVRVLPNGTLDPSFGGGDGKVTTDVNLGFDEVRGVAIDAGGRIVAAGVATFAGREAFSVARYLPDGTLDSTFGTGGVANVFIGASDDRGRAVAIQSDGRIVVAGYSTNGTNRDTAVLRLDDDGSPDTAFGGDGSVTIDVAGTADEAHAVVVQPDGKLVVGGSAVDPATGRTNGMMLRLIGAATRVSVGDVTVAEGDSGQSTASFTVSLTGGPAATDVTFQATTADGSATAPPDYEALAAPYTIPAGSSSVVVDVAVNGDALDEPDEAFSLELSDLVGATFNDPTATATIVDDDAPPALSISDRAVAEGTGGSVVASFTVSMPAPSSFPVTVDYATADGTAQAPADYTATSGTATIDPGSMSTEVLVPIASEGVFEPTETFVVNLSAPANATIADGQGVGTITNDDPKPTLTIDDVTTAEGASGSHQVTFTVHLSAPSSLVTKVKYSTADGTATAASGDYAAVNSAVLQLPAGVTGKTFKITVFGDTALEADETFFVNLFQPTNATIADSQAIATITNDDA